MFNKFISSWTTSGVYFIEKNASYFTLRIPKWIPGNFVIFREEANDYVLVFKLIDKISK